MLVDLMMWREPRGGPERGRRGGWVLCFQQAKCGGPINSGRDVA